MEDKASPCHNLVVTCIVFEVEYPILTLISMFDTHFNELLTFVAYLTSLVH